MAGNPTTLLKLWFFNLSLWVQETYILEICKVLFDVGP